MANDRRGRPRLKGERYPNGRLRPTDYRSETQIRRIVEHGLALGLDPMLGSQAGRLRLQGHLNDRHLSVVDYIGRVYGRYEFYAGLRRRTHSPSYEASVPQVGREAGNDDAAVAARADFLALQQAIPDFPVEARAVIERLCVDDLHIPLNYLPDLIILLERIDGDLLGGRRDTLPLSGGPPRRRAPATRDQRFEQGAYAHRADDAKPVRPSELAGEAAQEAARDRAATVEVIEQGNARRTVSP